MKSNYWGDTHSIRNIRYSLKSLLKLVAKTKMPRKHHYVLLLLLLQLVLCFKLNPNPKNTLQYQYNNPLKVDCFNQVEN